MYTDTKHQGFSIVEIIVAAAIFLSAVLVFLTSIEVFRDLSSHTAERTQAALLLEEGAEAVQLIRDEGWDEEIASRTPNTPYSLHWNGDAYQLTTDDELIAGKYYRKVTFFEARRNASDDLSENGVVDDDTRRVRISIIRAKDSEEITSAEMLIHNSYEEE